MNGPSRWMPTGRDGLQRLLGGFDGVGDAFERAQGGVDGRGDGGGEEMCNASGGKKCADGGERCGGAFHGIVAGRAVDVDVEEGGGQGGFVGVGIAGFDAGDGAVRVDGDAGIIDGCVRSDQAACRERTWSWCGHWRCGALTVG